MSDHSKPPETELIPVHPSKSERSIDSADQAAGEGRRYQWVGWTAGGTLLLWTKGWLWPLLDFAFQTVGWITLVVGVALIVVAIGKYFVGRREKPFKADMMGFGTLSVLASLLAFGAASMVSSDSGGSKSRSASTTRDGRSGSSSLSATSLSRDAARTSQPLHVNNADRSASRGGDEYTAREKRDDVRQAVNLFKTLAELEAENRRVEQLRRLQQVQQSEARKCPTCLGAGITTSNRWGASRTPIECPACRGTGLRTY